MDFSGRPTQPPANGSAHSAADASSGATAKRGKQKNKFSQIGVPVLVTAIIILLIAIIGVVGFSNGPNEGKYVDTTKLQAVFLNTGQVYFGNIKALNSKYIVLSNIYYLQTANSGSSTTASNASTNVSLVKLGCEIHEPFDQMVINSSQVTFWENLQDGGQVAKAVSTFQKDNPSGQKCTDQSSSSSSTSNSVQSAGTSSTPASSTTKSTKP